MRYVLAILAMAFLLSLGVSSKADLSQPSIATCGPRGPVVAAINATIRRLPPAWQAGASVRKLPDGIAQAFIAAYDEMPPAGKTNADTVHMLSHPRIPQQIYVIMSKGGCVVLGGALPTPMVQKMMLRAQRTSA